MERNTRRKVLMKLEKSGKSWNYAHKNQSPLPPTHTISADSRCCIIVSWKSLLFINWNLSRVGNHIMLYLVGSIAIDTKQSCNQQLGTLTAQIIFQFPHRGSEKHSCIAVLTQYGVIINIYPQCKILRPIFDE